MSAQVTLIQSPSSGEPHRWLWTRDVYYLAGEQGVFQPNEQVELIEGEVFTKMSPIGSRHAAAVHMISDLLHDTLDRAYFVRTEAPLILSDLSEPEPDLCVVPRRSDYYAGGHPEGVAVVLLIEVSDTTVNFDRGTKAMAYSAAGIPEYWIINLTTDRLEVFRRPDPALGYQAVEVFSSEGFITPSFAPALTIAVANLLPPALIIPTVPAD